MNIIEAEGLNKFYGSGQNRVHVLKDVIRNLVSGRGRPLRKVH